MAWSYAGAAAKVLAQLVIQVGLARVLGPASFGQAGMAMIVLGLGWLLADGGFGSALIQRPKLCDADIAYALGWVVLLSGGIGIGLLLAAPLLATAFGDQNLTPLFRASAVLVPLQALSNIPMSLLRRELEMKRQQLIQVASYVLGMGGVGLALALQGLGAWSLIGGFAAQTLIVLCVGYFFVRHPLRMSLTGDPGLRNFGLHVMGTNVANWAIDNLDRIIVGRIWGQAALGGYSAMANLSHAPIGMLVGSVQSVVFASTSRAQHDKAAVATGFLAAGSLVLLITGPVFCYVGLNATWVVTLLYGEHWLDASALFAAFCATIPSYALLSVAGPALWGLGAAKSELKVQLVAVAFLLAGFALLADTRLAVAVWIVPAVYAGRAVFVSAALASRLAIAPARVFRIAGGGALLALAVGSADLIASGIVGDPAARALLGAALALGIVAVLVCAVPRWIFAPELRHALLAQAGKSVVLARFCTALGLRAETP